MHYQPLEFAIFNDGVPSSVYYGSHPEHDVLMHIEDEALDESFPPDASDVSIIVLHITSLIVCRWLVIMTPCIETILYDSMNQTRI